MMLQTFTSTLRLVLVGGVLSLALAGCSGGAVAQSGAPDWFEQPSQAYSEEQYLTAVASGPSAQAAEDQAFGNLARVFEADIQAERELMDDYQEVKKDGEYTGSQRETRMITRSDVQSNQKLLNAKVLERTTVDDTYYALVGMERRETVRIYSEEIKSNRSKIEDYRTTAEETEHPIDRLAVLQKALVLAKANERLVRQRNIVAGGSAPDASSSVTELEEAVRDAQTQCPTVVQGQEVPSNVMSQVNATLEAAGFRVIDRPDDAVLEAKVSYEERSTLKSRSDAHFLRWTLDIALTDRVRGQTLETFTTEQRSGMPSEAAAQRRAHNDARTAIEEDFSTFLNNTLLSIDSP